LKRGTPAEFARLLRRGALLVGVLVVAAVGAALALNGSGGRSLEVLPPPAPSHRASKTASPQPRAVGRGGDVTRIVHPDLSHRGPLAAGAPPGAGSLAGAPGPVLRRFATLWANRSTMVNLRDRHELLGLSGGAWARQVLEQISNSLPAIPGVRAEGTLVVFRLEPAGPGMKTAVVLTKERLAAPSMGESSSESPYRYTVYLAHLDWLDSNGYVVTGWEQQT
jgi:hypothetical protein